jgi:perosamine synthetase
MKGQIIRNNLMHGRPISMPGRENVNFPPRSFIPYGRQWIDAEDIEAFVNVLHSDWLTTGPKVEEFEKAFANFTGARAAVAVSSGTAALHTAMHAIGVGPGDEVIVPPITFVATANAVVFQGGRPVFADVDPDTLLIDPERVREKITSRTKAIVAVDYAGHPCRYDILRAIADRHGIALVADACHALGAIFRGKKVGTLADLTAFSFHPVKHITTGEGGAVTTDDAKMAGVMRRFRNHGIDSDHRRRSEQGTWHYEMVDLGYNYRITDFQCALGLSQLRKLPQWLDRRREIARWYDEAFAPVAGIEPLVLSPGVSHAYHLYVVRCGSERLSINRASLFAGLCGEGIGANVHYMPVHLHPYYRQRFGCKEGDCPQAETAYGRIISLPMFPRMHDRDVRRVISAVIRIVEAHGS